MEKETPRAAKITPFDALFAWIVDAQETTPLSAQAEEAVLYLKLLPIEALVTLLDTEVKSVEGERVYSSSKAYGDSRYHLISKRYDGSIQLEQTNMDDKWGSRVHVQSDQLPTMLKTLLSWYLDDQRKQQEQTFLNEDLGELTDHPF